MHDSIYVMSDQIIIKEKLTRWFWCWGVLTLSLLYIACLFASPLIGWCEKRIGWILVSAVPLGYFWMYAVTSHFIPRYSKPLIPIALVCMAMVIVDCLSRLIDRKQTEHQSFVGLRCR